MSVLTQLTVPGEARPLKIAPEAIYSSSFSRHKLAKIGQTHVSIYIAKYSTSFRLKSVYFIVGHLAYIEYAHAD